MPKESVHYENSVVSVGWTKGTEDQPGHVQVIADIGLPFWFDDESLNVRDLEVGGPHQQLYVGVSREGINRLIRLLRSARDQAFEPDE